MWTYKIESKTLSPTKVNLYQYFGDYRPDNFQCKNADSTYSFDTTQNCTVWAHHNASIPDGH